MSWTDQNFSKEMTSKINKILGKGKEKIQEAKEKALQETVEKHGEYNSLSYKEKNQFLKTYKTLEEKYLNEKNDQKDSPSRKEVKEKTSLNEAESGSKEAYKKLFKKMLKKYNVDSPSELDDKKKKEFFNAIDKAWNSDDEAGKDGVSEDLDKDSDDPCWDGYVQVGTKMKDGKEVPNCVPMNEAFKPGDMADIPSNMGGSFPVEILNINGDKAEVQIKKSKALGDFAGKKMTVKTSELKKAR